MSEVDIVKRIEELDLAIEDLKAISTRGSGEDLPVRLRQRQLEIEAEQKQLRDVLRQARTGR